MTGIALRFAGLSTLSQPGLRLGLLFAAVLVWIACTVMMAPRDDVRPVSTPGPSDPATRRDALLLGLALLSFIPYVVGVVRYDWGFNELSALFLVGAFVIGLTAGLGVSGTAIQWLKGMEGMLAAALLIGVARAMSVVLTDGRVLDTIVYGLAAPLAYVPGALAGIVMVPIHALLHVPVFSVSGQAVLTMQIMAPLADLLGLSHDAAVIAYQTGAGLMDMITPTNGALTPRRPLRRLPCGRALLRAPPGQGRVGRRQGPVRCGRLLAAAGVLTITIIAI